MIVASVVGARPQFVKASAFSAAVSAHNEACGREAVRDLLIHSGQHFDANMSGVFFGQLGLPEPAYHLGVGGVAGHGAMTGRMLESLEKVLEEVRPDVVLVYGDTNTTLAGVLAASKLNLPVAHVEAGLRSGDRSMPEEVNRVVTDHLSSLLFCPTSLAVENLVSEGLVAGRGAVSGVYETGDVMYDAALAHAHRGANAPESLGLAPGESFALCTVHRQANVESPERLGGIFQALREIAQEMPVVFPVHPRTARLAGEYGLRAASGVRLVGPVGYFESLGLVRACSLVLTDSGGLQKEAYFFAKPCVTLREETEWRETVTCGCNVLAGTNPERIARSARGLLSARLDFSARHYGDGTAARRILGVLLDTHGARKAGGDR
ncbi:MAG: non-hydrolyzing UDP-N-acetylglucosamine 2-epimerase [Thermodesulfobacteriota bacterium]